MIEAYLKYSELRNFANTQLTPTRRAMFDFLRRMSATSNQLDSVIGELIDLAEERLQSSRRLLSKQGVLKVQKNTPATRAAAEQPAAAEPRVDGETDQPLTESQSAAADPTGTGR
jgi:hypothetical protein